MAAGEGNTQQLLQEILEKIQPIETIRLVVEAIKTDLNELKSKVNLHDTRINLVEATNDENSRKIEELNRSVKQLRTERDHSDLLKIKCSQLENKIEQLEDDSRKLNVIITGVKERRGEICKDLVYDFLEHKLLISDARERIRLVKVYRLGRPRGGSASEIVKYGNISRPILVQVLYLPHKQEIMSRRKMLNNKVTGERSMSSAERGNDQLYEENVWINDDLSEKVRRTRSVLKPVLKLAKEKDENAYLYHDKLCYKGRKYMLSDINSSGLNLASIHTYSTVDAVMFYGRFSPFSNFHPVSLEIDGRRFTCVEQFYQYSRALEAGKHTIAAQILLAIDPVEMKKLGDQCKSTEMDRNWYGTKSDNCMKRALCVKFNKPVFKDLLKKTEQRDIMECNKFDYYWSCGLSSSDPQIGDKAKWKGQNVMGRLLVAIRSDN